MRRLNTWLATGFLNYAGVTAEPRAGILVGDRVIDLEGAGIAQLHLRTAAELG